MRPSKAHFAGTPCVDWSPFGAQSRSNGSTMTVFAAWAALRILLEEVIIVHENSSRFDVNVLEKVFGNNYIINSTIFCPTSLGWPVRRSRRWTVLIHRQFVLEVVSSIDNTLRLFERAANCSWHIFMVADDEEKMSELTWASNRPTSMWPPKVAVALSEGAFEAALTRSEQEYLRVYMDTTPAGCIHKLNQNPSVRGVSSTPTQMHVIIKNTSIDFSTHHRRWLCPSELLAAQGFPVPCVVKRIKAENVDAAIAKQPMCSFVIERHGRKAAAVKGQAGNSMNVNVCGAVWLYVLSQIKRPDNLWVQGLFRS